LSVLEKVRASDAIIWLDEVQYTHGGWSNRNRMPGGSWLTVPVERSTDMAAFNRVRISEHRQWRTRAGKTIINEFGDWPMTWKVRDEILRPYRLLIGLNLALLKLLLFDDVQAWHFQSHLDGGHAPLVVSESPEELAPISWRLAMMVAEIGGTTYLSGPSGRKYLDEGPFQELGVKVEYFEWSGANPCGLARASQASMGYRFATVD
jgi:hypothetical protein